jgi:urease accessory protein
MLPLSLLLLVDSRAPAGAHSHSSGMEPAVAAGLVRDVEDVALFCAGRARTAGRVAAGFAAASAAAWGSGWSPDYWLAMDREADARLASPAGRAASRSLGRGLRRLITATLPRDRERFDQAWSMCPRPAPHHALVLGAAAAASGADPCASARAAILSAVTGPASAALRLLGLDPYDVQAICASLAPLMESIADAAAHTGVALVELIDADGDVSLLRELPADSAPALDILADVHLNQEVRLFAS